MKDKVKTHLPANALARNASRIDASGTHQAMQAGKAKIKMQNYPLRREASNSKLKIKEKGLPAIGFCRPARIALRSIAGGRQVQAGQAFITLLFFVLISLTITSGAIIIIIANSISANKLAEGTLAYYAAESGIENALLRLLRDPNYTGEILTIGEETASITVTGANPKTVVSIGQNGNFKRTISAQATYNNGYYTFSNWKEL